jgi:hypothetical protein
MNRIRRKKKDIAQLRSINQEPAADLPAKIPLEKEPIIKWKTDEEKERRKAWQRDAGLASDIFHRWKSRVINRRHTTGMLIEKMSELIDELDQKIEGSDWKNYTINEVINPCIARLHESHVLKQFTQAAVVDCPKCEWGGLALFHQKMWEEGRCEMDCPECCHRCTQKGDGETPDMITEEQAKAIRKEIEGGKDGK